MTGTDWDFPAPHIQPQTVDQSHLDPMRHTNNVVYLARVKQIAGIIRVNWACTGKTMSARATAWLPAGTNWTIAPTVAGDSLLLATGSSASTGCRSPAPINLYARAGQQNRISRPHPMGLR